MFKCLHHVQSGFLDPQKFSQNEITKRCYNLQLSHHQNIESVHTAGVNTLDIERAENRYLLSGCSDGSIYIHDVNNMTGQPNYTAKCICKIVKNSSDAHRYSVECVSWYGDDNVMFITSGTDKTLKVWDANTLKSIEKYHSKGRIYHHSLSISTFSPIIAVVSSSTNIELIDLRTGGSTHELRGHDSSVLTCSWSPREENLLATGGRDQKIFLWDVRSSNACLKQLDQYNRKTSSGTAHSGYVNGLRFTPDGLLLVSLGTDNQLRLWETLNGYNQEIDYKEIPNDVKKNIQFAISNNSKPSLLYIPSEGNIYVVEMLSGTLISVLYARYRNQSVNCCFYREPYQELYGGGNDGGLLLYTADCFQNETGQENVEFEDNLLISNVCVKTKQVR